MKQNLNPCAFKLQEPFWVTACLLHNESASCPRRQGQGHAGAEAKASANSALSRRGQTRSCVIYPRPGRTPGDTGRRAEPVGVEKPLDELRMGAKDQSNPVIAGSLRNSFRASPGWTMAGVERPFGRGSPPGCRRRPNSEYRHAFSGSQTSGDKLRRREGNSPDRQPRPPIVLLVDCKDVASH